MVEVRGELCFAHEVFDELLVVGELREETLERDLADHAATDIDRRAMHGCHATGTKTLVDFVSAEALEPHEMMFTPRLALFNGCSPHVDVGAAERFRAVFVSRPTKHRCNSQKAVIQRTPAPARAAPPIPMPIPAGRLSRYVGCVPSSV